MSRILIIDDDPQVGSMLKETLEEEGYDVTLASNGMEGVQIWKKEPFDMVITDLLMPKKEGLETIIELKRASPQTKIIAVSGGLRDGSIDVLDMAKKLGASRTFPKPVELSEFLNSVHELLSA